MIMIIIMIMYAIHWIVEPVAWKNSDPDQFVKKAMIWMQFFWWILIKIPFFKEKITYL